MQYFAAEGKMAQHEPRPTMHDPTTLGEAAAHIRAGRLVAMPTETVYGLAADATNARAVAAIYAAKGRPSFNPLIVHVSDAAMAARYAELTPLGVRLATAFWPGPLTLVLPKLPGSGIADLVTAGLDTVAIRVPAHPLALELIRQSGRPLAAPSANPSGRLSPTRAADVAAELGDRIALVLDGGPARHGVESTVVDACGATPVLLRPGAVTAEEIERVAGCAVLRPAADPSLPSSPGQLASHYAPNAALRLDAADVRPGEALLAFGPGALATAGPSLNLSPSGDLVEAAANLFAHLRALDASGVRIIAVMPIPAHGLGEAITDRLRRAAAPRG